jgi:glucuronate isomerase
MKFLDDNFLLRNKFSQALFHDYAKSMPIIDYHCHVSAEEIYNNREFKNITEAWLGGDHYKWRIMRSNGIDEKYITGDADDYSKFEAFAESLEKAIGNPMYHWCHLELKTYFGYEGVLSKKTAKEVWDKTAEAFAGGKLRVRDIINQSNVAFIGTTDDPADSLEWHKKLQADDSFKTLVAPSYRPDKAVNIDKAGFVEYIEKLSNTVGYKLTSLELVKKALAERMDYFASLSCCASDHGLDCAVWNNMSDDEANAVFKKALKGKALTPAEIEGYKTNLVLFCAEQYARLGWVFQIHYKALRNPNSIMFDRLGADTGYDIINPDAPSAQLAPFLNALNVKGVLPKTVIYSLDPGDNAFIGTLIGAFQGTEAKGKIQHGSAWWFNDNKQGMIDQIVNLANLSLLGNFIGMLTDSRSFLSYTRHEYFRRILCDVIGTWAENGEVPDDMEALGKIASDISYTNAKHYFALEGKII